MKTTGSPKSKSWPRQVRKAILHAASLAHWAMMELAVRHLHGNRYLPVVELKKVA